MQHGAKARFLHFTEIGVQADSGQRGHHEELAQILEEGGSRGGNQPHAVEKRQAQETQDKPREEREHVDPLPLHSHVHAALFAHVDDGEDQYCRNDGQRARELDHGGKIARRLAEGIARGHHAGGIIDRRARPQAIGHVAHAQPVPQEGKHQNHDHVKQEGGGHGVGDIAVLRVDHGRDGRNGRSAANACARRDQVAQLPVEPQAAPHQVAAAKTGEQRKAHHHQRQPAYGEDIPHAQRCAQQNDRQLEHPLGGELESPGHQRRRLAQRVDSHADEQRNDRGANEVNGQKPLQKPRRSRHRHCDQKARHHACVLFHPLHIQIPPFLCRTIVPAKHHKMKYRF